MPYEGCTGVYFTERISFHWIWKAYHEGTGMVLNMWKSNTYISQVETQWVQLLKINVFKTNFQKMFMIVRESIKKNYPKLRNKTKRWLSSVQLSSVAQLCPTLCDPMNRSTPGLPVHHQLLESTQTHVHWVMVMPSNHLILCHPLLLLPSIFPSTRVFSNESVLHIRWPKYWSFSFSISPSNEYLGLIFFRIDWFDLLAVQGTLKSLLQHHSSKASIFGTQLSL